MRLHRKVAIITGAGSGIGQATARLFAREGAQLVLNDIDQPALEKVLAEIGKERSRGVAAPSLPVALLRMVSIVAMVCPPFAARWIFQTES
jgi:NAD(P)-dependent dehydrogenase (short-subunit alcohol dehydrogenase family)